ncbi:DUF3526 domain-containing protein [Sphingobium sp. BYY-5]|uniref:DUF3526 domain-containing protein n=1 Tax=Sphingobium sp. BYY-5 TaxID=2926400 RepID=UPI001FA808C0|nr:DUF3526 domain-containing protein [Sphingobium sp. BYY-5]MCI4591075.1 DUF3526 domain-containing protein [Sphingobium sp. BYY-5]
MSAPRFVELFAWEWRQVGRTPLLWAVLLTLAASFLWGAVNTANFHRAQVQAQARTLAAEAAHRASLEKRAAAYRAPVTPDAPAVPYWQDPTNVSGFSQYFVFQHAMKPHLPLSPLAAGVSDLAPSRLQVKLNTIFGFDDSYDFENPRVLALGRFDLGFAVVYLLPIALILLFGLLVTFERDRGMLRLVAAQSTGPRLWLGARVAAILAWSTPTVLVAIVLALGVAGVSFAAAWPELITALLLTAAYMLLWAGIATLVLSRLPGAASALGTLAAIWTMLAIGLPLLGSILISALSPPPSGVAYVDIRRQTGDAIEADRNAILKRAIAARPDLSAARDRIDDIDYATELTFLAPETEKRLAPSYEAITAHADHQAGIAAFAGYLSPPLGLESALATLAGTDSGRHRAFEAQTRAYQLRLRGILYPLVQKEIVDPTPMNEPAMRGRFNLIERDFLPRFAMSEEPPSTRVAAALPLAVWLLLLGGALTVLGLRRAVRWPREV